jgi:hypothetical protein
MKLRRLAEIRLLEFTTSLKFFCRSKTKALNCALLCNFATAEDSRVKRASPLTDFDLYIQNYFMYISRLVEDTAGPILPSDDDTNYIELKFVKRFLIKALEVAEEITKHYEIATKEVFMNKLKAIAGSFEVSSVRSLNGAAVSIDIDKFYYILFEEYLTSKRRMEVEFIEEFLKKTKSDRGSFVAYSSTSFYR